MLKELCKLVEARNKTIMIKRNFDACAIQWCSDGSINGQYRVSLKRERSIFVTMIFENRAYFDFIR